MPRQPRIDFPGAFHHVMNRGADHQDTFRNDADRYLFLRLWADAASRFGIEVIAFCLMGNHFHVFAYSPDGQLSDTMQAIGRAYTQAFNQRHGRDGALFRGRFHSVIVDSESYFAQLVRYIDLNPVAAGLCSLEELREYKWSSFRYYASALAPPEWLATKHVTERFSTAESYRRFVQADTPNTELDQFYRRAIQPGRVLGRQDFIDEIYAAHSQLANTLIPGVASVNAEEIDAAVVALATVDRFTLYRSTPGIVNRARGVAIDLAHALTFEPRQALAHRYGFRSKQAFNAAVSRSRGKTNDLKAQALRSAVLRTLELEAGLPKGLTLE